MLKELQNYFYLYSAGIPINVENYILSFQNHSLNIDVILSTFMVMLG